MFDSSIFPFNQKEFYDYYPQTIDGCQLLINLMKPILIRRSIKGIIVDHKYHIPPRDVRAKFLTSLTANQEAE